MIDLRYELVNFKLDVSSIVRSKSVIRSLNCQLVHTLKHILYFLKSTFSCLYCRYTILCVVRCLIKTSDLSSHLFGN